MSIEENINTLCNKVKDLREKQKITLQELSKQSGVSQEVLEQLERNILPEEMMVDDAFALARVFGCKVYELFE